MQALNRTQRVKKYEDGQERADSPHSSIGEQTPLQLQIRSKKVGKTPSENDSTCGSMDIDGEDTEGLDGERSSTSTPLLDMNMTGSPSTPVFHEVELVFKPMPVEFEYSDSTLVQTRYIKTTTNATVDHLVKYLSMRHILDLNGDANHMENASSSDASLFTIYVGTGPGQFQPLVGPMTLLQINEKYWKFNKPLELFYAYKISHANIPTNIM